MSSLPPVETLRKVARKVNGNNFLNRELIEICQSNGLPAHGVKAVLQSTIVKGLEQAYTSGNAASYHKLEESIRCVKEGSTASAHQPYSAQKQPRDARASPSLHARANQQHTLPSISNGLSNGHGYAPGPNPLQPAYGGSYGNMNGGMASHRPYQAVPQSMFYDSTGFVPAPPLAVPSLRPYQPAQGPTFHPSPFYQVIQTVGSPHLCHAMSQHRNSITIQVKAQDTTRLKQCADDKTLRVMVFCAAQENGVQDIAFPHQSEMKINGDDVKANLRGLKNKPGSTRPVDITDLLRLKLPAYSNSIEFTYALTKNAGDRSHSSQVRFPFPAVPCPGQAHKSSPGRLKLTFLAPQKFWLVINICKTVPVEELVRNVTRNKISKASVIHELTKEAHDDDIQLESQVMSLKCPISYMRLTTPVRASTCSHVQCFDATSYLQLQQQGPQWVCPVCSKPAPFERLAVDEYVREILANTSRSAEQVDIQPDGRWKVHGSAQAREVRPEPEHDTFNLDDDEPEVSDTSLAGGRSTAASASYGRTHTPNGYSFLPAAPTPTSGSTREGSSISRSGGGAVSGVAVAGGAAKRKHEVIDLTLSDDEDDEQPAPKRQDFNRPGAGFSPYYG